MAEPKELAELIEKVRSFDLDAIDQHIDEQRARLKQLVDIRRVMRQLQGKKSPRRSPKASTNGSADQAEGESATAHHARRVLTYLEANGPTDKSVLATALRIDARYLPRVLKHGEEARMFRADARTGRYEKGPKATGY